MNITLTVRLSAQKLRSLMCTEGFTRESLAAELGCSARQVGNWMRKDTDVHISYLFALGKVLAVNADELLIYLPITETE